MKNIILLTAFMLTIPTVKADFLIEVRFEYRLQAGHGVTMYYSMNDLSELYKRVKNLDTITERKVLAIFGMPLDESNNTQESCVVPEMVKPNYKKLFTNRLTKAITYKTKEVFLQVKLLSCDYKLCTFPLTTKFWGSYDVNFKEAGVIMSNPVISSWSKNQKLLFAQIQKEIKEIKSP